jgi:hypothetical protein
LRHCTWVFEGTTVGSPPFSDAVFEPVSIRDRKIAGRVLARVRASLFSHESNRR